MFKKTLQGVIESNNIDTVGGSGNGGQPNELEKEAKDLKHEAEKLEAEAEKKEEEAKSKEKVANSLSEKIEAQNAQAEAVKKQAEAAEKQAEAAKKLKEAAKKYGENGETTKADNANQAAEKLEEKAKKLEKENEIAKHINDAELKELNEELKEEQSYIGVFEQKKGKVFEIKWGQSHEIKGYYSNEVKFGANFDTALGADFKFEFGPTLKFSGLPLPYHGTELAAPEASFHNTKELKFNVSDHGDDKYSNASAFYTKDGFSSYSGYDEDISGVGKVSVLAYEAYQKAIQKTAGLLGLFHIINCGMPIGAGIAIKDRSTSVEETIKLISNIGSGIEALAALYGIYQLSNAKTEFREHFVPKSIISNHHDQGVYLGATTASANNPNTRQGSELFLNKEFRIQVSDNVESFDIDRKNNSRRPYIHSHSIPTSLVINPDAINASANESIELRLKDRATRLNAAKFSCMQGKNDIISIEKKLQKALEDLHSSVNIMAGISTLDLQIEYQRNTHKNLQETVSELQRELALSESRLAARETILSAVENEPDSRAAYFSLNETSGVKQITCEAERILLKANNANDKEVSSVVISKEHLELALASRAKKIVLNESKASIQRSNDQRLNMTENESQFSFDKRNSITISSNKISFKLNGKSVNWTDASFDVVNGLKVIA
jgi:glucan-binding YG repeat protein